MESASTTDETWREGDSCLAPHPRDGSLRGAFIHSLLSSSSTRDHGDTTALVTFTNHDMHEDEDEEEKESPIPVSELLRPPVVSNQFSHEKPQFASLRPPAAAAVPLVLSAAGAEAEERVPYTINRYLRDYQRDGIRFIHNNYTRARGCILGDDMGLGKTVQVIGFLSAVLHKTGTWEDIENNKPRFLQTQSSSEQRRPSKVFLIVAPLSVLYNWKEELDTWSHVQCVVIHGLRKEEELGRIRNGRFEVALTTYETLRLCLDQFNSIDWSAVIVDEAHKLKNPKSQITQAMKELMCKIRIGLTGTILQNNLEEFWCVMDWAVPGCLGSLGHFKNHYSDPVERGQKHSATKRSLATARRAVRGLAKKISPWFLRRTKAFIKDQLPKKDDRVVYCALTDFQQTVYQTVLDTDDVTLILRSSDKCDCQSGRTRRSCCYKTNSDGVEVKGLYFSYLAILRKVANHVALLQSTDGTSKKQKEFVGAVCKKVFQKFPDFMKRCKEEAFEAISDPMYSGKMKVLQKLLRHYLKRRDKVLLFSFSTKLLDVLVSYCMAEGLDYSRLDGTTKAKDRVRIVKEFNSCPHTNLCLVSTMAGGLGLNFVGANVVVLFDPTWNPANDLQAIDRAYRIGQCRDVTVLRLISLGTVEEIIYLRQVYKQQLHSTVVDRQSARRYFEAVQGTDGHQGELFGTKNLFRLQTQGTCLTRRLLEREGRVEAGVDTANTHAGGADGEEEEEEAEAEETTSEPGKIPPGHASKPNSQSSAGNPNGERSTRGVLDFSSGEEDDAPEGGRIKRRKMTEPRGEDGATGATSAPASRLSLLQCGFSRVLLLRREPAAAGSSPASAVEDSSQSEEESRGSSSSSGGGGGGGGGGSGPEELSPIGAGSSGTKKKKNEKKRREEKVGGEEEEQGISRGSSPGTPGDGRSVGKGRVPGQRKPRRRDVFISTDESDDLGGAAVVEHGARNEARGGPRGGRDERRRGEERDGRKRRSVRARGLARSKHTEHIELFTSSDEEHTPVKKGRSDRDEGSRAPTDGRQIPQKKSHTSGPCISNISSGSSASPRPHTHQDGTIDGVLGGVSEVLYTHSNQRVVGGSKAEERISRAAVRDVFERKMYSQFPANHLLGTQESESEDTPESSPPRASAVAAGEERPRGEADRLRVQHPVTFSCQAVHRGPDHTFILGQTPKAIRRPQLEQMASSLCVSSVRVFAEQVLSSSSSQRLAWLRQYCTSLNQPELTDMVTGRFPKPASAPARPSPSSKSVARPPAPRPQRRTKVPPQKARGESLLGRTTRDTPRLEPHKTPGVPQGGVAGKEADGSAARERKRTKRARVSITEASGAAGGPCSDLVGGGGRLKAAAEAAALGPADRDAPSSPDLRGSSASTAAVKRKGACPGESSPRPAGAAMGRTDNEARREASSPPDSGSLLLAELIGDTSILDDLFRPPAARGARQQRSQVTPSGARLHADASQSTHSIARAASPPPLPPPPPPRTKPATSGRKDFWDILNEGSEESMEWLTDPSVLERVCTRTDRTARNSTKGGDEGGGGGSTLWKTNDKFLWKK